MMLFSTHCTCMLSAMGSTVQIKENVFAEQLGGMERNSVRLRTMLLPSSWVSGLAMFSSLCSSMISDSLDASLMKAVCSGGP